MNIYQLLATDWRIRLLAQLTCAPMPPKRPADTAITLLPDCRTRPAGSVEG